MATMEYETAREQSVSEKPFAGSLMANLPAAYLVDGLPDAERDVVRREPLRSPCRLLLGGITTSSSLLSILLALLGHLDLLFLLLLLHHLHLLLDHGAPVIALRGPGRHQERQQRQDPSLPHAREPRRRQPRQAVAEARADGRLRERELEDEETGLRRRGQRHRRHGRGINRETAHGENLRDPDAADGLR